MLSSRLRMFRIQTALLIAISTSVYSIDISTAPLCAGPCEESIQKDIDNTDRDYNTPGIYQQVPAEDKK